MDKSICSIQEESLFHREYQVKHKLHPRGHSIVLSITTVSGLVAHCADQVKQDNGFHRLRHTSDCLNGSQELIEPETIWESELSLAGQHSARSAQPWKLSHKRQNARSATNESRNQSGSQEAHRSRKSIYEIASRIPLYRELCPITCGKSIKIDAVHVAPPPLLAALSRLDDWMLRGFEVRARMAVL